MKMRGAGVMVVIVLLVSTASSHPECRPASDCAFVKLNSYDGNKFQFDVNVSTAQKKQQFIIKFVETDNIITLWCNSHRKDISKHLPADDPALPMMSPPVSVSKVQIIGCTVPKNGSYYTALKALNITFSSDGNGILWLTQLPSEPQLEEHHMEGLPIKELLISANDSRNPTRPRFNFLNKLQNLKILELRQNVVLEKEAIEHLPEALESLTLKGTHLPTAENELGNGSFWLERLHSLRYMFVWEDSKQEGWANRTLLLPPLASLHNLTTVKIQNVRLPPIPNNKLWLNDSKLQILELESCGLSELPRDLFTGANLTILTLNKNNLSSLPEGIFSPLRWLTALNMSYNNLDGGTLQLVLKPLMKQLKELRVNNNPLGSLCGGDGVIQGIQRSMLPTSLRLLDLMKTGAKRICDDWIEKDDGLMYINLEGNNISKLSYTDLSMKRRVDAPIKLFLKNNPLRKIKITKEDFHQCLNASSSLKIGLNTWRARVELHLNKLECECDDAYWLLETLHNCSRLLGMTKVSCDPKPPAGAPQTLQDYHPDNITCGYDGDHCPNGCDCRKRSFDNATVVRCGTLPREPKWPASAPGWPLALHVAPATLTAVPPVTLVELHAPNNNITSIDKIPPTLRVLDLTNNSIAHISEAAADSLFHRRNDRGYSVSITGSRLACACDDEPAISKLNFAKIKDWDKMKCVDGKYVTMTDKCENKIMLPLLVALSAMLMLTLVTVYIRFKLPKIRQFLFDHNMCLKWVLGVKDIVDDPMKTHDVFISYSYNDDQYAKKLIEKLEERGHSTIEHCRDWLPGKPVPQQITHSVMSARRTLLLVSDNYANSKWGLEEFHAAHAHAMEHGSARVIVVRYKLLAPQDLPPELQLYLYNNTYLDWSDRYFWDKLWRVMPTPRAVPTPAIALLHSQDVPPSVRIQVALESTTVPALQLSGNKDLPLSELVLVPPTSVTVPLTEYGQNQLPAPASPVTPVARLPATPLRDKNTPLSRRTRRDPLEAHLPNAVSPCAC